MYKRALFHPFLYTQLYLHKNISLTILAHRPVFIMAHNVDIGLNCWHKVK